MLRRIGYFIKCVIFMCILIVTLNVVNRILIQKYYYTERWPVTTTINDFYKMKKNTVDVLTIGSSHVISGIIPQELYDTYGIRSYTLGTPQQSMIMSYFWLREALKTQSPKLVLLESTFLFDYFNGSILNCKEPYLRMAMDFMHLGKVKQDAVMAICKADPTQDMMSFYLPNIRYHSRWEELTEDDFDFWSMDQQVGMKGFSALKEETEKVKIYPFVPDASVGMEEPHPIMKEYFEKIISLCKENNIELVLMVTPCKEETPQKYNTLKAYADKNNLMFIDFNDQSVLDASGIILEEDMEDKTHCNYKGAKKVTKHIGNILSATFGIPAVEDDQWSVENSLYKENMENCGLIECTDLTDYLNRINQARYTVFIATKGSPAALYTEPVKNCFIQLGLEQNLSEEVDTCYFAVLEGEFRHEECQKGTISLAGQLRDGHSRYEIICADAENGETCSISIDGKNYAVNKTGINIVVYDNLFKTVIDSVLFDTSAEETGFIRK